MEKSIEKALKFFKEDFEKEGILKDGMYNNQYNMLCNFARKVLDFERRESMLSTGKSEEKKQ